MPNLTCAVEECSKKRVQRAWCATHYARWYKYGDVNAYFGLRRASKSICKVDGCEIIDQGEHGYCPNHYRAWKKYGDPLTVKPRPTLGDHPGWTGDSASYGTVHDRLRRQRGSASVYTCTDCEGPAYEWSYDGLDPEQKLCPKRGMIYSLKMEHYVARCVRCHRRHDLCK